MNSEYTKRERVWFKAFDLFKIKQAELEIPKNPGIEIQFDALCI